MNNLIKVQIRNLTTTFVKEPYVRKRTISGIPLQVGVNSIGYNQSEFFLKNAQTNLKLSPWHDISIQSSTDEHLTICGVIEFARGSTQKVRCKLG